MSKKGISHTTTWKWLHEFGFEYKERQKCYFSDKHENEENVSYRKKFVHEYFETELNMYRWVHLKENIAKKLEKEEQLMGIYHEFVNDENKKVREYHIDVHEKLNDFPLTLSVRRPASQLRPTIIIGQDESVFKQYSFS